MNTNSCENVACRVGSWWSAQPKIKQDLMILAVGITLVTVFALVGGSVGEHGVEAWTWHIAG